jgi:predicted dinucleotide-binding enzyme
MDFGRLRDHLLTAFVASDDAAAKKAVMGLARGIGFDRSTPAR